MLFFQSPDVDQVVGQGFYSGFIFADGGGGTFMADNFQQHTRRHYKLLRTLIMTFTINKISL